MSSKDESSAPAVNNEQQALPEKQDVAAAANTMTKKPYEKPSFQHECIFETMALSCGKVSPTQRQCAFNRKRS
jgi:hypothetical protein